MKSSLAIYLVALSLTGTTSGLSVAQERGDDETAMALHHVRTAAADNTTIVQSLTSEPGHPVPLMIAPPADSAKDFRFVMVRGLPETVSLSAGFRVRQSWFIAARDVEGVQLWSPEAFHGNFTLEFFFFHDSQEAPLASAAVSVRIGSGPGNAQMLTATPPLQVENPSTSTAKPPRPRAVAFSPEQEAEMLRRGEGYLRIGDVASARLLYEDLAAHGSAEGMLAMGRTYDPNFLKETWVAGGLQPNLDKAKLWYQRAADMGEGDAQKRLSVLGGR